MTESKDLATTAPASPTAQLHKTLTVYNGWIEHQLPKHMTAERMIAVAMAATTANPDLLKCNRQSVALAVMQAASLGLYPDGRLGSAYLVPYKEKCQLIIGYRGLIDLATRAGDVKTVHAEPVYVGDDFTVNMGTAMQIDHHPDWEVERTDETLDGISHFYVVFELAGGYKKFAVMTIDQVKRIKGRASSASGPWKTDPVQMGLKTVIKRGMKSVRLSPDLQTAMILDDASDAGVETQPIVADVPRELLGANGGDLDPELEPETKTGGLADALEAQLVEPARDDDEPAASSNGASSEEAKEEPADPEPAAFDQDGNEIDPSETEPEPLPEEPEPEPEPVITIVDLEGEDLMFLQSLLDKQRPKLNIEAMISRLDFPLGNVTESVIAWLNKNTEGPDIQRRLRLLVQAVKETSAA